MARVTGGGRVLAGGRVCREKAWATWVASEEQTFISHGHGVGIQDRGAGRVG